MLETSTTLPLHSAYCIPATPETSTNRYTAPTAYQPGRRHQPTYRYTAPTAYQPGRRHQPTNRYTAPTAYQPGRRHQPTYHYTAPTAYQPGWRHQPTLPPTPGVAGTVPMERRCPKQNESWGLAYKGHFQREGRGAPRDRATKPGVPLAPWMRGAAAGEGLCKEPTRALKGPPPGDHSPGWPHRGGPGTHAHPTRGPSAPAGFLAPWPNGHKIRRQRVR